MDIQYILSLLLLFLMLLLFLRRPRTISRPRVHTRDQIMAKQPVFTKDILDLKHKILSFREGRKKENSEKEQHPRQGLRVKYLDKGTKTSLDKQQSQKEKNQDYLNTLQKKLIIKSIRQNNLVKEQSQELQELLQTMIRESKGRMHCLEIGYINGALTKGCNASLLQYQQKIKDKAHFKVGVEQLHRLQGEGLTVDKTVLAKFIELSLQLGVQGWAAYFINEMVAGGMQVPRGLLDQFIQTSFKQKFRKQMDPRSSYVPEKTCRMEVLRRKLQNGEITIFPGEE